MPILPEEVINLYTVILDRPPESQAVINQHSERFNSASELRDTLLRSTEFQKKYYASLVGQETLVLVELDPETHLRIWVDLTEPYVSGQIAFGKYEEPELQFVAGNVNPGDTVLDIGANIGFYTLWLAQFVGPSGHVEAYEPVPATCELLARSIEENTPRWNKEARSIHETNRVSYNECALGPEAGQTRMACDPTHPAQAHLYDTSTPGETLGWVDVYTLDHESEFLGKVSFIKIDVEGAEPQVFKGGETLLARDHPIILSELYPAQLQSVSGVSAKEYIAQLAFYGYTCWSLGAWGGLNEPITDFTGEICSVVFMPTI